MSVSSLAYIVIRGPVEEWRAFGASVLGLQEVATSDHGRAYFRTDDRIYRIVVQNGDPGPDALLASGWEVRTDEHFDALLKQIQNAGFDATENSELAKERRVRRIMTATDPDGNCVEIVVGLTQDFAPFVSPRGVTFVCGEMGLGHIFMSTPQTLQLVSFYREALGFRETDTIDIAGTEAHFMHCNERHHSLAVASIPTPPKGLGHLMLEVDKLEDVGRALDEVKGGKARLAMEIGEHSNDHMISFYVQTPSGFHIEYGWNGVTVDDDNWTVGHYTAISNWGHQMADGTSLPKTPAL